MIVLDATALLFTLVAPHPDLGAVVELGFEELHAPARLDDDVLAAIVAWRRCDRMSSYRAETVLADFVELAITRHPVTETLERLLEVGPAAGARRASYLALARVLDAPLMTADPQLDTEPFGVRRRLLANRRW